MNRVKLRCARCGSNAVVRTEFRRFACLHCGAEGERVTRGAGFRAA